VKVELIGWTGMHMPTRILETQLSDRLFGRIDNSLAAQQTAADVLAEVAGRICYDSFHLPSPDTATNEGYLANIIKQRHESVLEHASATFLVQHVSRSLLAEITRHRHLSFSVRSTRYVDETQTRLVIPPALRPYLDEVVTPTDRAQWDVRTEMDALLGHTKATYTLFADLLMSKGLTRKQAREAAREFLPGGITTEFVVSGNHRAWREMLRKRLAPGAAAEIGELAQKMLCQLKDIAPNTYQDF
jgi:thymidylate synthase (FAD)